MQPSVLPFCGSYFQVQCKRHVLIELSQHLSCLEINSILMMLRHHQCINEIVEICLDLDHLPSSYPATLEQNLKSELKDIQVAYH